MFLSFLQNYEEVYNHSSYHDENPYEEAAGARQINGHASHTQQSHPPRRQPQAWNQEGQTEYLQVLNLNKKTTTLK